MENRTIAVIALILVVSVAITVSLSALSTVYKIQNTAQLKTVGVTVFSDANCTQKLLNITWGILGPGENKNFSCYVRSDSNTPVNLSMHTENWQPANITSWTSISWSLEGFTLQPNASAPTALMLAVNGSIPLGFSSFSFDIVFVGSG